MKAQGLSKWQEDWLRALVGNSDPKDRLSVQKMEAGYIVEVELETSKAADLLAAKWKNRPPLKLKPVSSLNFCEVIRAVTMYIAEINK